jgi:hypothetical protein
MSKESDKTKSNDLLNTQINNLSKVLKGINTNMKYLIRLKDKYNKKIDQNNQILSFYEHILQDARYKYALHRNVNYVLVVIIIILLGVIFL